MNKLWILDSSVLIVLARIDRIVYLDEKLLRRVFLEVLQEPWLD